MRSYPCLVLLVLTACPGDAETTSGTTGSSSDPGTSTDPGADTGTSTSPETDTSGSVLSCPCILDEEPTDPNVPPAAPICDDASCPRVVGSCGDTYCALGGVFELADPTALECALVALRDRTPGLLEWSFSEGLGIHNEDGYLVVDADGTAIRRHWDREDLNFAVSDAVLGPLPAAAVFDACLAEPDARIRFDCLRAELEQPQGTCDEGWMCWECF